MSSGVEGASPGKDKRKKAEPSEDMEGDDTASTSLAEVERLLADTKSDMLAQLGPVVDEKFNVATNVLKQYIVGENRRQDIAIKRNEEDIGMLKDGQERLQKDNEDIWKSIKHLQQLAAVVEPAEKKSQPVVITGWDTYNQTIIRISTAALVQFDSVRELIQPIIDEINCPENLWKLKGGQLGQRFTIQFLGDPGCAGRRASSFHEATFDEQNGWKEFFIHPPAEQAKKGQPIKVYINRDKPKWRVQTEQHYKLLCTAIEDQLVDESNIIHYRREFAITKNWVTFVSIAFNWATKKSDIEWKLEDVPGLSIDKEAVEKKFRSAVAAHRSARHRG